MMVLGISEEHDAGIALVENGKILLASNEERYTRKKVQRGFPKNALDWCINRIIKMGIGFPERIVIASKFHVSSNLGDWQNMDWKFELLENFFSCTHLDRFLWGSKLGPKLLIFLGNIQQLVRKKRIGDELKKRGLNFSELMFIDHHTCHGSSAYFASGWNECLVITQDASGDGICSKVFFCRNGKLEEKHSVPFFHSPGHYYEYVTFMLGFKIGREGKVTGLAARGDPSATFPIFMKELNYDKNSQRYINHGLYRKAEINKLRKKLKNFSVEDIAAGVQKHLEVIMINYIRDMIRKYASKFPVKLALAGGVFANVRLNQKIAALPEVKSLFIFPHMGDGGLAAGAALSLFCDKGLKPTPLSNVYFGDDLNAEEIELVLNKYKRKFSVTKPRGLAESVAKLLANDKVVAIVRGRMEYGPRALGHRSLLYKSFDPTVNIWLNRRLRRSEFMPFAPIIRREDLPLYFSNWEKVLPSLPFMTVALNCNERCKKEAPAIVHVDGTARPQVLEKGVENFVYDILSSYFKLTKLRILINTSFNMHEQPIVRNAQDAVLTFLEGHIDYLVLEDRLITLKESEGR